MLNKEQYKEKIELKKEKYEKLMIKNKNLSDSFYSTNRNLNEMIPLGQPILIGHHSEKKHRNHLNKINTLIRKSIDTQKKSEFYENKLNNLKNNHAVSSDDPEAILKLENKLISLEEQRTKIKEYNKNARKVKEETTPSYMLANLGQNIISVRGRIKLLKNNLKLKSSEKTINNIKIIQNTDINRIQLEFQDKPSAEKRKILKSSGFRWSFSEMRWQRQLNNSGIFAADTIVKNINFING